MTFREIHDLERKSKEIWVVSPNLHFDVNDRSFQKVLKQNHVEKTKYRYIVPNSVEVRANLEKYKKKYKKSEKDINEMFLLLPESEFSPFLNECAIYGPRNKGKIACAAPCINSSENDDAIKFDKAIAAEQTGHFRGIWKRYKRQDP